MEQGTAFTRFQFSSAADFQKLQIVSDQPAAMVMDEFTATVEINSSHPGIRLALRLVLPEQIDPRTGQPLVVWVMGEESSSVSQWQTLSVVGSRTALQARVRQLRTELSQPQIDTSNAYFDACGLLAELHHGTTFVDIGPTTYGPVVTPKQVAVPVAAAVSEVERIPLTIERDQVMVGSSAVFLRITPDHCESIEFLQRLGVNGVWVPDLQAEDRMRSLIDHGLLVLATPPHPEFDPADFSKPLQGLTPLDQAFPLPAVWLFGTGIAADQLPHLLAWAREVRSADRTFRRPLMGDVVAAEGVASRQIDFVGISQHSAGWLKPFGLARNRSYLRQNASAKLTLPWEWIQTEPATGPAEYRKRCGLRPAVVEPEQILMQLVASLSAGSRGVGFWKTRTLEARSVADQETAKAIELANLYLQIIEPLVVASRVDGHLPVKTGAAPDDSRNRSLISSVSLASSLATDYSVQPSEPDAAVMTGAGSSLILAAFWDNASHFVPQSMFAQDAHLTVTATETATAWQIFPTGLRGLRRRPVAGGLRLDIQEFDQLALMLVTSDIEVRHRMDARIQTHARRAAELFIDLAELKLNRVSATCQEIDSGLAGPDTTAAMALKTARQNLETARQAMARGDFTATERWARACMRDTRGVQNRYWQRAVQSLPTAMATPHTHCFATLPDYWEMVERIQSGAASDNLMTSGSFDSLRLLSEGAWKKVSTQEDTFSATADIVSDARSASHVLRLRAWRRENESATDINRPTVMVQSPEVMAEAGEIFEIQARVKRGQSIPSDQETPLMIFDSDLGPEFAVSPRLEFGWQTVRLYRQASVNGPFRVWLALNGAAEVFVDDLSVVRRAAGAASP
ncbi:MAG: hypothetical protein R3C59_05760 [Planctomycetaceae bacterium]